MPPVTIHTVVNPLFALRGRLEGLRDQSSKPPYSEQFRGAVVGAASQWLEANRAALKSYGVLVINYVKLPNEFTVVAGTRRALLNFAQREFILTTPDGDMDQWFYADLPDFTPEEIAMHAMMRAFDKVLPT